MPGKIPVAMVLECKVLEFFMTTSMTNQNYFLSLYAYLL